MPSKEKSEPQMIKLTFYPTPNKPSISITANPSSTLEDAIKAAGEKLKNYQFIDRILFAELNGLPDEFAVLPDILCQELKQGGKVRAKSKKGATPSPKRQMNDDKENVNENKENNVPKKQIPVLFFVKSNNRGITKIPNSEYEGKQLCVLAYDGDRLEDAILNDGRFSDQFMLLEDNDRKSEVPLHYAASDHSREVFIMKKRPGKRKLADKPCTDESETESQTSSITSVYSSIPDNINDPFTEEIGRAMVNDARKNALETFVEAGVEEDTDKHIKNMIQKFGKKGSCATPTRILPTLTQARKSVGLIYCGDVTGTCFLLAKVIIITCQHIFNEIKSKRSEATDPELYRKIFVYFDYEYPQRLGECFAEVDETRKPCIGQGLDYAICCLKPSPVLNDREPLSRLIRSPLPRNGLVILMGHPESENKVFEACRIIPKHNWHATLCSRASEAEHYCQQNTDECQIESGPDVKCIHMHKGRYLQGDHSNELPYDTSFFHGSSGSPVFNADGHIVAMHTQGYPYHQGSKKVSLMEFGVIFKAVYEDVKRQLGDQKAKMLFPEC